jgi:YggT family protein
MHLLYWIPTYLILAAIAYLIARAVLSPFFATDSPNVVWRFLRVTTDPVLRVLRPLIPRFIVDGLTPIVAAGWLLLLWLAFRELMLAAGFGAAAPA